MNCAFIIATVDWELVHGAVVRGTFENMGVMSNEGVTVAITDQLLETRGEATCAAQSKVKLERDGQPHTEIMRATVLDRSLGTKFLPANGWVSPLPPSNR